MTATTTLEFDFYACKFRSLDELLDHTPHDNAGDLIIDALAWLQIYDKYITRPASKSVNMVVGSDQRNLCVIDDTMTADHRMIHRIAIPVPADDMNQASSKIAPDKIAGEITRALILFEQIAVARYQNMPVVGLYDNSTKKLAVLEGHMRVAPPPSGPILH